MSLLESRATASPRGPRASEHGSLVRDPARSYGDAAGARARENMLVHGDNLSVLERMQKTFAQRFSCVYLDPPFNTGRTFAQYKDARSSDEWREMMGARLTAMRPLLAEHGSIFVEIDDTELGNLQVLMDGIFGARNRISTITVVRSATTGHKAKNAGPVNTTDYLLMYAKSRAHVRYVPQVRPRDGYDAAYGTYLMNREASPSLWRFAPLAKHAAAALDYPSRLDAVRALGKAHFLRQMQAFALAHCESVVRFAQPRYEAVSREARVWIDRSRAAPNEVLVLERMRHKPLILRGGNRVLFLADKVRGEGATRVIVEPLTNVWNDVPFQGIAKEGGVVFSRNKKPERLLARILSMTTSKDDWVLDPFLGSGTTAAVAHKMGRRWVGIEDGAHIDDLCLPRLRNVVDGSDKTGITKETGWQGGGGFGVYR